MFEGYKTYVVAFLMLVHAISGYFLGSPQPLDVQELLLALGLATVRRGVQTGA